MDVIFELLAWLSQSLGGRDGVALACWFFARRSSGAIANIGMPLMAIGGLAFGWWLTRCKPLISRWYVLTVTGGVTLACCAAAVVSLVGPVWVWNPFLMPVSFGLAAGAGVLAPWLRV